MIGLRRLDNIQFCIERIIEERVPGDLLEAGVWRGGASVFMRGVLQAYGVTDRTVWLADSFKGLPPPDPTRHPADRGDWLFKEPYLAVSLDEVRSTFERYGLLDDRVRFIEGWFRQTLPDAPVRQLALLRLDGDMYESTMDALSSLFPRVVAGGFVIIDDFNLPPCRQAVTDFRERHQIADRIETIDWAGVFWRKG
jgi:Macrocin-O-methyltransferase (TylF)